MVNNEPLLCKIAQERHRNAGLWLYLWNILLWVFGAALVGFLIYAILVLLLNPQLSAALGALGAIVSGAAIRWVVDRRTKASEEEKTAYEEVIKECSGPDAKPEADARRDSLRLFRRAR
jgi:membrane protein implicated in regulation of membrane protease activity